MKPVRILSFNIHGGRTLDGKRDTKRIHRLMEEMNVDIGVFQEIETRLSRGGRLEDVELLAGNARPYRLKGPSLEEDEGWYGNLIVSRFPIIRGLVHNLETGRDFEPRNAVDGLIESPIGKIRLIGTHLSLSFFQRWSEVRNLIQLMNAVEEHEKSPVILMGDINEWVWRARLLRHLDKLMIPVPCKPSFPSLFPFLRLDRVWYDAPELRVTARILDAPDIRKLSDHLPLLIEIQ